MIAGQVLVEVHRKAQSSAKQVAHQPLPIGRDIQPLDTVQCEKLLTSPCEWTSSPASFLFRNIALQEGGASFPQLREKAKQEYTSENPGAGEFPLIKFAEFLEAGYRVGLLVKNYISPNGDIHSPERIMMFEIAASAQELLARHIPADIEKRTAHSALTGDTEVQRIQKELAPLIEYLRQHGPSLRDTMLDELTRSVPDDAVNERWDHLENMIDQGLTLGILSQQQDRLGGKVISVVA